VRRTSPPLAGSDNFHLVRSAVQRASQPAQELALTLDSVVGTSPPQRAEEKACMSKSRSRSASNLAKTQGADLGEYVLLAALIALIIGVVVVHVAHVQLP
jgi:hypothetical protein